MTVVLTQYQNCAMNTPTNSPNQNVKIIQELSEQKVAFLSTKFEIRDAVKSVVLNGLCAKSNQISWTIKQDAQALENGKSECVSGSFQIGLNQVSKYPCGRSLALETTANSNTNQNLEIVRLCSPLMAEQLSVSEDDQDVCFKELKETEWVSSAGSGNGASTMCEKICYHNDIVALKRPADCADLKP